MNRLAAIPMFLSNRATRISNKLQILNQITFKIRVKIKFKLKYKIKVWIR